MLILPNVAIGLVVVLVRMLIGFFLWTYHIFSIDICLVPSAGGVEAWDVGYAAYVAAARSDHRYNNPIALVFIANLQDELKQRRLANARLKVRTQLRRNIAERRKQLQQVVVSSSTMSQTLRASLYGVPSLPDDKPEPHAAQRLQEIARRNSLFVPS